MLLSLTPLNVDLGDPFRRPLCLEWVYVSSFQYRKRCRAYSTFIGAFELSSPDVEQKQRSRDGYKQTTSRKKLIYTAMREKSEAEV